MHFYPFNIGDYRKDTSRLNFLEHGIYRILIDEYYLTEHPLNKNTTMLMRECGIRLPEEIDAFKFILDKFFILDDDGYRHYGCEKVLEKIYSKSESARKSVQARWARKNTNVQKNDTNVHNIDTNVQKNDTPDILPITHNPIHKDTEENHEASASVNQVIQVDSIQSLFNKICTDLPKCQNLSDARKKRLRAQFKKSVIVKGKKYPCDQLDFWEKYFYLIHSIDWLNGRTDKKFNIDFDYIIRESNIIKFCEAAT